jgi:predicted Fe-S protein YdhL (DUF1289 family)
MTYVPPPPIKSPCVQICVIDRAESGLCLGCFRSWPEIEAWRDMTPEQREAIMTELPARESLIRPEQLAKVSWGRRRP